MASEVSVSCVIMNYDIYKWDKHPDGVYHIELSKLFKFFPCVLKNIGMEQEESPKPGRRISGEHAAPDNDRNSQNDPAADRSVKDNKKHQQAHGNS